MRKSNYAYDSLFAGFFQPAIWLRRVREQVSPSKLGGLPWLSSQALWPRHGKTGRPLHFLAQVDLATLPATPLPGGDPREALPRRGALFFFADMDAGQEWNISGGRPADGNPTRVVYAEAGPGPMQAPPDIPNIRHSYHSGGPDGAGFAVFPECWLKAGPFEAIAKLDLADFAAWKELYTYIDESLAREEANLRMVESAERGMGEAFPVYRAPDPRQSLSPEERQRLTKDANWQPAQYFHRNHPKRGPQWSANFTPHQMLGPPKDVQGTAGDMRKQGLISLLQLDSDSQGVHHKFMFCDCGMAQFWISPEDLHAHRFDRAWATTEGG